MNILVDALNIAFRSHHVYDVKQGLTTSEGIPTGLVYGFLQTLAKWKRKYPHHDMTVVWDRPGGKEWRQEIVPEYKANRPSSPAPAPGGEVGDSEETFDIFAYQVNLLHNILPHLGVHQASAPGREADDVIAYLCREMYADVHNIILTSDRDLLQLVTTRTVLATPDDKFYDVDKVVEEYGVIPEKLVHLRALFGDTSDNLPGIPRFRKKVAARLVNEHGSVDSIYNQPVTELGLTKKESEKLAAFQEQARKNLQVMGLLSEMTPLDYRTGSYNQNEINTMCDTLEFKTIRNRLLEAFNSQQGFLKHVLYPTD